MSIDRLSGFKLLLINELSLAKIVSFAETSKFFNMKMLRHPYNILRFGIKQDGAAELAE